MESRRIAVRGIAFEDGKLFAVKHKEKMVPSDFWAIPGGGLDPGESLEDGLHREMIEEMGVAPKIGKLLFIQQYRSEKREFLEFSSTSRMPTTIDPSTYLRPLMGT